MRSRPRSAGQRVAVARALVNQPMVVLADEPTGNLDSAATTDVLRLFGQLHSAGQALLIVTHDGRVSATADRLLTMRDGAIVDQTLLGDRQAVAGATPGGPPPGPGGTVHGRAVGDRGRRGRRPTPPRPPPDSSPSYR